MSEGRRESGDNQAARQRPWMRKASKEAAKKTTQGWFLMSAIINKGEGRRSGSVKKRTESSSRR